MAQPALFKIGRIDCVEADVRLIDDAGHSNRNFHAAVGRSDGDRCLPVANRQPQLTVGVTVTTAALDDSYFAAAVRSARRSSVLPLALALVTSNWARAKFSRRSTQVGRAATLSPAPLTSPALLTSGLIAPTINMAQAQA